MRGMFGQGHSTRSLPSGEIIVRCEYAEANRRLHEDLARDHKAARLVWVQVQAEGKPTEPGHIQAGNGHAIRVAGPVLKVVAALDQGRAVQRALERG